MEQILSSYAGIIVAFVAGLFSFLGLVIAKENKTSEFRQAWIDELRTDLAKFVAAVYVLDQAESSYRQDAASGNKPAMTELDFLKTIQPTVDTALSTQISILLRLNPNEKKVPETPALIEKVKSIGEEITELRYPDARVKTADLLTFASPVLKKEWRRVKRGEPIYWIAKWTVAAFVFLVSVLIIGRYFSLF